MGGRKMVRFGPSGNDDTFYQEGFKKSVEAPKWLADKGLSAYEYSLAKGVNLKDDTAIAIGEEAKKYDIAISIHAPYYINFANPSEEMAEKSYGYVLASLRVLKLMQGNHLVVHTATDGKLSRQEALELVKKRLPILVSKIQEAGYDDLYICLETMGKQAQIGTYEEIIDLCTIYDHFMPTFDFGHINALTQGSLKTMEDFEKIVLRSFEKLGEYRTKNMHVHFSKIEYGSKGEIKHLTFEDTMYGPEFEPFAKVIKKYHLTPTIICESKGTMALDAVKMKNIYEKEINNDSSK